VKRLDSLLNHILFGVSSWIFFPEYSYIFGIQQGVAIAFINKFATTRPNFRLYPFQTTLVAGLYEIFHAVDNGTFTNSTFLSVFAAPSFTLWALQGMIDACLFVPPLVVVAAIFGKWLLGHFGASRGEDRHEQARRQRPLHAWPKDARARALWWLEALHTILAVSEAFYCMCWITGKNPRMGISILVGVAAICSPALFMLYQMKKADL
jgi:hypothetical protein